MRAYVCVCVCVCVCVRVRARVREGVRRGEIGNDAENCVSLLVSTYLARPDEGSACYASKSYDASFSMILN